MKMQAAVLRKIGAKRPYAISEPIQIEEVELDPPQAGELLIKIAGGGLCHSDLSIINGNRARPMPLVLGHEGSGEVVEVGAGVRDIKVGDPIVFQFSASCGLCRNCLGGRPQLCETHNAARAKGHLMAGGSRMRDSKGVEIAHQSGVSCFAEYAVIDRGTAVKVDKDLPLADAAIFGCAVMTGVGAVLNTARIRAGDTVACVGLGGVGLNGLMGAKLAGAEKIIAVDISDDKLGLARQLGATHTVNALDDDHVQQILDLTNGGVDFAFEFSGSIAATETCYKSIRVGGEVIVVGLAPTSGLFSFNPADIVNSEKAIRGSYMGSCVPVRDIPRYIELYRQGRLPVDKLINRSIGFKDINDGFDRLADGLAIRQILEPGRA
jgi:alcohol dehydrogenase